eukprot:1183789-Prorocentrum_minimum.AAC.3
MTQGEIAVDRCPVDGNLLPQGRTSTFLACITKVRFPLSVSCLTSNPKLIDYAIHQNIAQ